MSRRSRRGGAGMFEGEWQKGRGGWRVGKRGGRGKVEVRVNVQMRDRNTGQPDRLHPSVRIHQAVQLRLHLTRLRCLEPPPLTPPLDIPLHEKRQLQRQTQPPVLEPFQSRREQVAVLGLRSRVACTVRDGGAGDDGCAPACAEVVLGRVEDGDQDADDLLGVLTVGGGGCGGGKGAGDEESAGEVADGGDYYREVITAVPEAVVGGLVAKDLGRGFQIAEEGKRGMERGGGRRTSMRPTTMERLGICGRLELAIAWC